MSTTVEVVTPSRLHFGMFSFGRADVRQFGGVGLLVDRPGLRIRISPARAFESVGPLAHRIPRLIQRLGECWQLSEPPRCRIEVLAAPPEHLGLGTGTQLELAVAAGLQAFRGGEPVDAPELARLTGRGARSAVGTYGFLLGGLVVESGKLPGERLAPLERRVALPEAWRVLLIFSSAQRGLAGEAEQRAFRDLPPVARETTETLRREVFETLIPAAERGDVVAFGESVYRFGHQAGLCFAASQGGPFASPRIAALIDTVRQLGVSGVGQSSWGPTVFAMLESDAAAQELIAALGAHLEPGERWLVAKPCATGAHIVRSSGP